MDNVTSEYGFKAILSLEAKQPTTYSFEFQYLIVRQVMAWAESFMFTFGYVANPLRSLFKYIAVVEALLFIFVTDQS